MATTAPDIDRDTQLRMYRTMQECRLFEVRAQELFFEGLVRGTTHLGIGQEAVAAGVAAAMRDDDYTFCTYRGHNHTLARGVPMAPIFAELFGRGTGLLGGKGGSMHLTSVEHHAMGSYAIVGAHLPIALGAAWSAQYRKSGQVAVCFFGDGTTNIGSFHEALNMAAVWKAPVVFVCENNQYMEYTAIGDVTAVARPAADRASAYGLEAIVVDGNDVEAVHRVAAPAVDRARAGDGPSLIEAITYRHGGHSRADPGKYRPDDEVAAWKARDPIPAYRARLLARRRRRGGPRRDRRGGPRCGGRGRGDRAGGTGARARTCSRPRSGRMEARRGGTDVPRGLRRGDRPGDGARPERRPHRRGRRRGRRRVQADRGPVRPVRRRARPRHADQRAGHRRGRDGRRDDRPATGRRADVHRLLRGRLGHGRQPDRQDPLHDRRPGLAAAGAAHGERGGPPLRRPAQPERRELGDGDPGPQGRRAVDARPTSWA